MTQEQIREYNKLCAEFLKGFSYIKRYDTIFHVDKSKTPIEQQDDKFYKRINTYNHKHIRLGYYIDLNELKFHEDWNWLMELVQKCLIGEAEHNTEISNVTIKNIYESLCNTNIEDVFESCVKYIKWYNANKISEN